jgi:hypothetical protein
MKSLDKRAFSKLKNVEYIHCQAGNGRALFKFHDAFCDAEGVLLIETKGPESAPRTQLGVMGKPSPEAETCVGNRHQARIMLKSMAPRDRALFLMLTEDKKELHEDYLFVEIFGDLIGMRPTKRGWVVVRDIDGKRSYFAGMDTHGVMRFLPEITDETVAHKTRGAALASIAGSHDGGIKLHRLS